MHQHCSHSGGMFCYDPHHGHHGSNICQQILIYIHETWHDTQPNCWSLSFFLSLSLSRSLSHLAYLEPVWGWVQAPVLPRRHRHLHTIYGLGQSRRTPGKIGRLIICEDWGVRIEDQMVAAPAPVSEQCDQRAKASQFSLPIKRCHRKLTIPIDFDKRTSSN